MDCVLQYCAYMKWCRVFYGGLGHIIIREIDAASVGGIIVIKTYHHFVLWHGTHKDKAQLCGNKIFFVSHNFLGTSNKL
jgi:hypothetical protein